MIKKLGWNLLAAALVFAGSQLVRAQDQSPAPADQNAPAAAPAPTAKHHGHGMMEACKDDVAQYCSGQKGKALRKCMDDNADKLSQGCKDARAKAMKHHQKAAAPADQPAATPAATGSQSQ